MVKRLMVMLAMVALLVASLASLGYAVRDTHVMKHWHPMFVEPALGYFGLSFFGHEHTSREHKVEDGAFVDAPITSCWDYDFLERDCDGPDHYKAYLADGSTPDSMIGAYKGDPSPKSPPRAKACAVNTNPYHKYCVSDYRDDGKTVWLDTRRDLERHTLTVGCPGPRLEYPCTSKDPKEEEHETVVNSSRGPRLSDVVIWVLLRVFDYHAQEECRANVVVACWHRGGVAVFFHGCEDCMLRMPELPISSGMRAAKRCDRHTDGIEPYWRLHQGAPVRRVCLLLA